MVCNCAGENDISGQYLLEAPDAFGPEVSPASAVYKIEEEDEGTTSI